MWAPKQKGFTIVELLIVIVVIGILAAITIVAYNGVQQRARDAQRKSDLATIAKSLELYNIDKGNYLYTGSGCGSGGGGVGWFNRTYTGYGRIVDCLVASGALSRPLIDPSGIESCASDTVCRTYMKHTCVGTYAGTYLYASLESEPAGHDGPTNNTCAPSWDTQYGMNYVIKVD